MELSVVPSLVDLLVHPHLLHLTVFSESQKKASYKTPLKSPSDWRMNFVVEHGVKVYHIPNYGNQKKVPLPDNCLENKNGQIRLLLGNGKLLINIISSLQGSSNNNSNKDEGDAITNMDVIERRLEEEAWQYPQIQNHGTDFSRKLATKYTSKECKVELHRCCLRASIFDEATKTLTDRAVSEVISNARDKNVGYLDLHSISDPGCCCTKGGWKFFLISEHKLAREKAQKSKHDSDEESTADRAPPVVPMLVIADSDNNIVEDTNGSLPLNQIPTDPNSFEVHGDAFSIIIPPQNPYVLDMIKRQGLHCRIFLYRCLDKKYSNSSVKFVYYDHGAFKDSCPFCMIKRVSQLPLESAFSIGSGSGSGNRARKRAKTSSLSVQSPADSSMSMSPYFDSSSSGVSTPSSSSSSPEPCNITDQLAYHFPIIPSSDEAFSSSSSNNNDNIISYGQDDYWSEIQGSSDDNQIPENLDGMWLRDNDIGSLIFDLVNEDLNTPGNVPIPDSCTSKPLNVEVIREKVTKVEEKENKDSTKDSEEIESEKNICEDEEEVAIVGSFTKLNLSAENRSTKSSDQNVIVPTNLCPAIFVALFAIMLYFIACSLWQ